MSLTIHDLRYKGMKNPVRVIHSLCGGVLFFHDGLPKERYSVLNPNKCVTVQGFTPREGDPIICSLCGYKVAPNQLQFVIDDRDSE